jgi:hypothetical protein
MIETLLWIYIAICLSLILFQCLFITITAIRAYLDNRIVKQKIREILQQLERISINKPLSEDYQKFLRLSLSISVSLYCYEKALRHVWEMIENGTLFLRDPNEITNVTILIRHRARKGEEFSKGRSKIRMRLRPKKKLIQPLSRDLAEQYFNEYIRQTAPAIVSLTSSYRKKDDIIHSFYIFMLKKYKYLRHCHTSELVANMLDLLDRGDSTCAEGVLLAIYQIGDPKITLDVLRQVDKSERFLHPKIISDGLLTFAGNTQELHRLILRQLLRFSEQMQVNLLNYLRFSSGTHCESILQLLQNEDVFDETRFSCIRYLGKYPYAPAYDLIARFATGEEGQRMEYAIIALSVLRYYPQPRTIEILRANINHSNWFIRYNATESLEYLGLEYQDLIDIFDGNDRFARDMLQYQFDQRYILDKEV